MKPRAVLFSPSLTALSGVSTHVNMLLRSDLGKDFELLHFQVGSEGRRETRLQKFARFIASPFYLVFFLFRYRPDIVHLNTSMDRKAYWRDMVYLFVSKLLRRRVVNQIHGGPFPRDFFSGNAPLTWVLRQVLLLSDTVTVLSRSEFAAYRSFDTRINVHLIPNAIDPAGIIDYPREINRERPLRLVYIGRLVAAKGLFDTIEALRIVRSQGRRFLLSIAGGGPDETRLREAVQQSGLADCVVFLGRVFDQEKNRLWLGSDVFMFPSHFEGLPYALLEAMAAGCVPVTTPIAAIPDVMQHNVHGLFVSAKDPQAIAQAIIHLDDKREELAKMAVSCRERIVGHYTVVRLAADFGKIYHDLMERKD